MTTIWYGGEKYVLLDNVKAPERVQPGETNRVIGTNTAGQLMQIHIQYGVALTVEI